MYNEVDDEFLDDDEDEYTEYTESDEWTTDDDYDEPELPRRRGAPNAGPSRASAGASGAGAGAGRGAARGRAAQSAPAYKDPGPPTDNPLLLRFVKQHQL